MIKIPFEDLPSTNTPISANNLNTMQNNIDTAKLEKTGGEITGNLNVTGTLKKGNVDVPTIRSGEWTPVLQSTAGSINVEYSSRPASYVRIGNLCFIWFKIVGKVLSLASGTNYPMITGLPFTPKTYPTASLGLAPGISFNLTTNTVEENLEFTIEYGYIAIRHNQGASTSTMKLSGDTNFQVGACGWYEINE